MTISTNSPDVWIIAGSVFMNFIMGIYGSFKANRIDKNVTATNGSVPTAINTLNDVVRVISKQMNDLTEQGRNTTVKEFETRLDRIELILEEIKNGQHDTPSEQSGKN